LLAALFARSLGAEPQESSEATKWREDLAILREQISTLWWQTEDPRDKRPFRAPDIAVEMRFADYVNNVDAALNAILQAGRPPGPPMKQPPP
jgi:hypothetical protein